MALKDSENLKRIEAMRPRYEKLRELRIRNDADLQRAQQDVLAAQEEAISIAGTANLDELRRKITADYEKNTTEINEFESVLEAVESAIAEIDTVK